jgi:hypothetical protein
MSRPPAAQLKTLGAYINKELIELYKTECYTGTNKGLFQTVMEDSMTIEEMKSTIRKMNEDS